MTSLRKFSIALLVAAALMGLMASPAQAQPVATCNSTSFPSTMYYSSSYQLSCSASGGTGSYSGWSISSGQIPSGMSYIAYNNNTAFNVSGIPNVAGSYSFTVTVTDSSGATGSQNFSVTVSSSSGVTTSGSITLSSASPTTLTAGQTSILYLYGTNFTAATQVYFNGTQISPVFQSSSQIYVTVQYYLVTSGNASVYVYDPTYGTSNTLTVSVSGSSGTGPLALTSISPTCAPLNTSVTLTVFGSGFTQGNLLSFGSLATVNTSFISSSELQATIPSYALATAQTVNVSVGASNSEVFTIGGSCTSTSSGIITLSSIYPTTLSPGVQSTIQVYGTNFTSNTIVYFNNNPIQTNYQNSSSYITATVPAAYVTAGSLPVFVKDPTTGQSTPQYVTVSGSTSTGIISLTQVTTSPTTLTPGTPVFLTVFGTNFTQNSVIHFDNYAFTPTFVSSNQLYANIPASYVVAGSLPVYVTDPSTGTSTTLTVNVGGSTTTTGVSLSSLQPASAAAGNSLTLDLFGSGFGNGALITFGAYTFSGTLVATGELQVTIPAADVSTAGTYNVSVGGSNVLQFTVTGSSTGSLTVTCSPTTGPATINTYYSQTCTVSGGVAPYTWVVSGLPSGLVQSAYTGGASVTITGTPTVSQSYSYIVQVTDSSASRLTGSLTESGSVGTASSTGYSITTLSPSSLAVGSGTTTLEVFGNGFTASSVVYFNGVAEGTTYVSTTQLNATIPASSLTAAGSASVSVNTSGTYTNTLILTLTSGTTTSGNLTVTCTPGIGPQTQLLLYSATCTASGGTQPYYWPTPVGLPSYLTLSASTGTTIIISGTPPGAGTYNYTVKVTDSSSPSLASTEQIAGQVPATTSTGGLSITSLSPSSAAVNSPAVTLTVNGVGFATNSQIVFNGFPVVTTYLSSGALVGTVPSGLLTFASAALVTVTTPGVGTSNALTFIVGTGVANQVSISCSPGVGPATPNSYVAQSCSVSGGTGPFTWSISAGSLPTGLSLTPNGVTSTITGYSTLNGPYSYTLQATDSSSPANIATVVFAGSTGSGSGSTGSYSLSSLTPTSIAPGSPATTITINGTGFTSSSIVYFNTTALTTTFINSGQISAVIPTTLLTTAASANITVQTSGITSNALSLTIGTGASTGITISCSPSAGPPAVGYNYLTTCTANGGKAPFAWSIVAGVLPNGIVQGYSTSSTITISGFAATNGSYNYTLQATDSSTPVQTASYEFAGSVGSNQGGGFAGTITSLNPTSAPVGGGQFTLTVTGSSFVNGQSFVYWAGTLLSTTYLSSTQLTAVVPSYLLATLGPALITVQTAGVGATNQVAFFVSGAGAVTVSPSSLSFTYALGGNFPSVQTLSVTSTAAISGFTVSATGTSTNNVTWLSASPSSSAIPGTVSVNVVPTGLAIGTYTGSVTITGYGTGSNIVVPVTLTILSSPTLIGTPKTLSFTTSAGTTAATQSVNMTSSDGSTVIPYTVAAVANNGGTWLTVTPTSGNTPGSFTVTANGGSLAAATYSGAITVTPSGSFGSVISIPVTFTVTAPTTLTASPTSITFNGVAGQANPAAQTVALSTSGSTGTSYTVATTTAAGGSWLSATASGSTTPGTISVTANTSGLAAGTYTGTVTVTASGATNSPLAVPVSLVVASPAPLTASPTSLTFSYQIGGTAPASQSVALSAPTGSSSPFNYTVVAATSSGGTWLSASPTTGATPSSVAASVSTSGLAAGTYTGTLTITASGAGTLTIPVTLTVTPAAATLSVSPTSLTFNSTVGVSPSSQSLSVTTTNNVTANLTVSASSAGNWLSVTGGTTTPGTVTVSANSASLAVGQYTGTVTIASPGATNTPQTVQVTLNVAAPPSISAAPQSLSFFVPGDGSTPAAQSITVISTGGNTNFTASVFAQGGNWLTATGGGTTPGTLTVSVNPSGLTAGQTYNGSVTINAPASNPSSLQVPVTLTVAAQGAVPLQIAPSALYLYYDQGAGSDLEHVVVINNGGGSVSYTVQGQTQNCGNWLTVVTPTGTATASAPGVIGVEISPSGLNSQTCRGSLTLTDSNGNTATLPVAMAISSAIQSILLSQTAMNFTASSSGSAPAAQTFQVLNPGSGSMPWSISASTLTGGSWLTVSPNSGNAPSLSQPGSPISVTVNPQGLAAGIYYGTVQVASSGVFNGPQAMTVTLTVTSTSPPAQVIPAGVILTGTNGNSSTQTVNITNSGSASLSYSAILTTDDGQSWLVATPTSGSISAGGTNAITLSGALTGLGTGLRHGTLNLAFSDGTVQTVDVQLALTGAASGATGVRACGPTNLAMEFLSPEQNFQAPAQVAMPLKVLVQDCNGNPLTSSNTGVDILVGTTNTDIRMTYTGGGVWSGTWTPASASSVADLTARAVEIVGGAEATGVIALNGATSAALSNAPPYVSAVVNAGSFVMPGLVAPGTMVSIFGSSLADGQMQVYSTPFPNSLEGAQFSVRGVGLPLFYASSGQVNAVIPIGLNADERDQLIVVRDTTQSAPVDLLVADTDPGVFAVNSQGTGQGAVLVGGTAQIAAPAGSIAGANAGPATAGQTVSIFVAGLGAVSNPPADGSPSTGSSLTTVTPTVTIGGVAGQVTYSGLAPGEVGLYQVNVVIPAGVTTGNAVPVVITAGNGTSNTVTIALQ